MNIMIHKSRLIRPVRLNLFSKLITGLVFIASSCVSPIEQISDIGGAGCFYVINASTRDTIKAGGGMYIGVSYPILNAKNGDEINLSFSPDDRYSKYSFDVTYTLPDSSEVEGKGKGYNYSIVVNGFEPGEYSVSMSAASTEQVITSYGRVSLKITE